MNSINSTPVSDRIQIGFFGDTNAGKSSLINAITGQDVSVVSEKKGTTTDPVIKTMELKGLGPVVIIDTPGLNDDTEIGHLREKRTFESLNRSDMAVLIFDAQQLYDKDSDLSCYAKVIRYCRRMKKPFLYVVNKTDLCDEADKETIITNLSSIDADRSEIAETVIFTSSVNKTGLEELKEAVIDTGKVLKEKRSENKIVSDIIDPGDSVVLVIPIDESAPEGRLILPQQQVIRDILDSGGNAICIKDTELEEFFKTRVDSKNGIMPVLVITDSQVFRSVSEIVPEDIMLTSFSILMARLKGRLEEQVAGAKVIDSLQDGDTVLISEGCTHHRQCEDIGTVKLPKMIMKYTGHNINIETSSGHGYPEDLKKYKLILHCGGCMLGESEMKSRIDKAVEEGVPVTNYGIAIAYMNGILRRSVEPLPEIVV